MILEIACLGAYCGIMTILVKVLETMEPRTTFHDDYQLTPVYSLFM